MANSVPVFTGLNPPTFSENAVNGAAQLIDSSVTLTDAEGNFSGGTLTVSGMLAEDMIAIRNEGNGAGEVGFANGLVTYGGTFIGFAGMVNGAFSVLFNANATTAAVDAVVENLTYANSSQTPTASRSLQVTVTDATGETALGGGMPVFVERFGADNPLSAATVPFQSRPTFADLDADGDLDVLVGRSTSSTSSMDYYENIGTAGAPVFASAIRNPFGLPAGAVGETASPSLADLDGDGDYDLTVGFFSSSSLYYFENIGSASAPSFAAPVQNAFGLTTPNGFNRTPTFADLDADGDLDAIVGIQNNFYYFENTGSATAPAFAAPLQSPFGMGAVNGSAAPSFGDFDGDGDLDFMFGQFNGETHYRENVGTATAPSFATEVHYVTLEEGRWWSAPAAADIDSDGDVDVFIGGEDGDIKYMENITPRNVATLVVTVTAQNDAPALVHPLADQTTPEDQAVNLTIPADAFSDPDGDTPSFAATLADGSALPTWLSFNDSTRTFSGMPPLNFSGVLNLKVTASDATLSVSGTFTLTITSVNDAPALVHPLADQTTPEDQAVNFTIPADAFSDPDGDTPSFTATLADGSALPTWLSFNDSTRTFSGTPPLNFSGVLHLKVTASDATLSLSDTFTLTITSVNDAPALVHPLADQTTPEDQAVNFTIPADAFSDPDGDTPSFTATLADGSALPTWLSFNDSTRTFSGTPPLNFSGVLHLKVTARDATLSVSDTFMLTITSVNDAPVVAGPVTLAAIDEDSGARLITQAELLPGASDVDGPSLAAVNLQISAGLGALVDNGDQTWTYTPAANDDTSVAFTYQVTDGTTPVATSARLFINPLPDTPQVKSGTPGDDGFIAPAGDWQIDGLGGIDTIAFDFKFTEATITFSGNAVIVDGPSSHTVLTGFERYVFTDGTVNNADDDVLVDDLFYFANYHDIWNAHADADAHYHAIGWKEGRDMDAFFSTTLYLALYADVKASRADPLKHFDQTGWKEGRLPSVDFDPAKYLAANPDVKAGGVDPLAQFLGFGAGEGRQPFAAKYPIGPLGFDYVYYLQSNPDVATAGADPLQHFQQFGWKEGRNPNAFFDVNGYLANYADVRAANVNPLDHYNQFGWHEGRDPSVDFDTTSYLAAYPDIAAATIYQFYRVNSSTPSVTAR